MAYTPSREYVCACTYKATSLNNLVRHSEYGPIDKRFLRQCCYCESFTSRRFQQFIMHMISAHGVRGRLEYPLQSQCPYCPAEARSLYAIQKHVERCVMKYRPERNLELAPQLFDIPLCYNDPASRFALMNKLKDPTPKASSHVMLTCTDNNVIRPAIPASVNHVRVYRNSVTAAAPATSSTDAVTITGLTVNRVAQQAAGHGRLPNNSAIRAPILPVQLPRFAAVRAPTPRPANMARMSVARPTLASSSSSADDMIVSAAAAAAAAVMNVAAASGARGTAAANGPRSLGMPGGVRQPRFYQRLPGFQVPLMPTSIRSGAAVPTQLVMNQRMTRPAPVIPTLLASTAGENRVCEVCGQLVSVSKSLRDHMWTDHGIIISHQRFFGPESERPVACPSCPRRFFCNLGLERHQRLVHVPSTQQQQETFSCPRCKQTGVVDILGHLRVDHSITLRDMVDYRICYMCRQNFTALTELQKHMLTIHCNLFPSLAVLVEKINEGRKKMVSVVPLPNMAAGFTVPLMPFPRRSWSLHRALHQGLE